MRKIYTKPSISFKRYNNIDNTNYIMISGNYGAGAMTGRGDFDNDYSYDLLNK